MPDRRVVPDTPETLDAVRRFEDESTPWRLRWTATSGEPRPERLTRRGRMRVMAMTHEQWAAALDGEDLEEARRCYESGTYSARLIELLQPVGVPGKIRAHGDLSESKEPGDPLPAQVRDALDRRFP